MRMTTKRRKIGDMLVRRGVITAEQLADCLRLQKETYRPLGQILTEKGHVTREEMTELLGEQLGVPHVWLRKGLVDPRVVQVLPKEKALQYQVIPMFRVGDVLTLASADPHAIFVFDEVAKITGLKVQPVLCRIADIEEAINECYRENVSIEEVMASIDEASIDFVETVDEREVDELAEIAGDSPVINLTNLILVRSIRDGASDIHIEPQPGRFRVRVRIDGILYDLMSPKMEMHAAVVSRLKIMAKLDIAERRLPQDGRIQVKVDGRQIDLRFSSMPGIAGEKVVLRILDRAKAVLDLNQLGFDDTLLGNFKRVLRTPYGLILTCGPTGSGKTTSLYSALSMLNTSQKNIVTIEDPVEYQLDGINQNQTREGIGLTFARFIKHALRQDPDVIMVGEIRDRETAITAIQASLTGHLVLSTLHTNDGPSAITRLLEMGIEPYLVASSLLAAMAQRLLRTVCPTCKTKFYAPSSVLTALGRSADEQLALCRGEGCKACYDSGYKGRIGIYKLVEVSGGFQNLIFDSPTVEVLRKFLDKIGFVTMQDCGYRKVVEGITTIEEVHRVISVDL